jgi:hypothetical protein
MKLQEPLKGLARAAQGLATAESAAAVDMAVVTVGGCGITERASTAGALAVRVTSKGRVAEPNLRETFTVPSKGGI